MEIISFVNTNSIFIQNILEKLEFYGFLRFFILYFSNRPICKRTNRATISIVINVIIGMIIEEEKIAYRVREREKIIWLICIVVVVVIKMFMNSVRSCCGCVV